MESWCLPDADLVVASVEGPVLLEAVRPFFFVQSKLSPPILLIPHISFSNVHSILFPETNNIKYVSLYLL